MSEVNQLEDQLAQVKELVARRDKAIRLSKNKDFEDLILDQFCLKECARYVQVSADPNLDDRQRDDALRMAQAAGHLKRFLSVVVQMGNAASGDIVEIEQALTDARMDEDAV
jgi:hypothetical protein